VLLQNLRCLLSGVLLLVPFTPMAFNLRQAGSLTDVDHVAIRGVLSEQQAAWNRGDMAAFMKGYWKSPQLTFAGGSGLIRGWDTVLARYQRDYSDPTAMGHLDFSNLEIRPLGPDYALVLGSWHLARPAGEVGGVFSLVFRQFPEGWRIIHDHTSSEQSHPH
jgi:ketosteroid isomerase-like protein